MAWQFTPIPCPTCGGEFTPKRRDSTTCSRPCGEVARGRRCPPRAPILCATCGDAFTPKREGSTTCSRQCYNAGEPERRSARTRRAPFAPIRCGGCDAEFTPKRKDSTTCSRRCGEVTRGRILREPLPPRRCELPECGIEFTPTRTKQRCCCEEHGHARWYRDPANAVARAGDRSWTDSRRDAYHRRRARKASTAVGDDPVLLADVLDRDGWCCHLCGVGIPRSARWPDLWSPSLDHVVPLSRGGAHALDNVRPAHLTCNVQKGNRVDTEEAPALAT